MDEAREPMAANATQAARIGRSFLNVDPEVSRRMARMGKRDTKPEIVVRRLAHRLGYRFRLQRRDLPGTPDVVFPGRRKVVQVHGCFWHQHADCPAGRMPRSRLDYWGPKLARNVERDGESLAALAALGWEPLVVWECETRDMDALAEKLVGFLGPAGS